MEDLPGRLDVADESGWIESLLTRSLFVDPRTFAEGLLLPLAAMVVASIDLNLNILWTTVGLTLCVTVYRSAVFLGYRRSSDTVVDQKAWAIRFASGAYLYAGCMGLVGYTVFSTDIDTGLMLVTALIWIGYVAASAARNAAFPDMVGIQAGLVLLPVALACLTKDSLTFKLLAVLLFGYVLTMRRMARRLRKDMVATHEEVARHARIASNLEESDRIRRLSIDASERGFMTLDRNDIVVEANPAALRLIGGVSTFTPGTTTLAELVEPSVRSGTLDANAYQRLRTLVAGHGESSHIVHQDGNLVVRLTSDGHTGGRRLVVLEDVTRDWATSREIETLSNTDDLTKLFNRRATMRHLADAVRRIPAGAEGGCIAYLDLDGFKQINDRMGHASGDRLLVEVADVLRSSVRSSDFVGRIGGDEFVIHLALPAGDEDVVGVCSRIVDGISSIRIPNSTLRAGVTIGLSRLRGEIAADDVIHEADMALCAAKKGRRRGTASFWSDQDVDSTLVA